MPPGDSVLSTPQVRHRWARCPCQNPSGTSCPSRTVSASSTPGGVQGTSPSAMGTASSAAPEPVPNHPTVSEPPENSSILCNLIPSLGQVKEPLHTSFPPPHSIIVFPLWSCPFLLPSLLTLPSLPLPLPPT